MPNKIQLTARTIAGYDKPFIKEVTITSQKGRILSTPTFDRGRWLITVDTEQSDNVTLNYVVEQLITDPRGDYESYIGAEFAVIDAETMFLYPRNNGARSRVRFVGPVNWIASSIWEEVELNQFSFRDATELHTFVSFGPFERRSQRAGNVKNILCVLPGLSSKVDSLKTFQLINDLTRHLSEKVFRPPNEETFHWVIVSTPITGGGIRDASFLVSGTGSQSQLWHTLAHEYIHLWNGTGLNTTRMRWFSEGATVLLTSKSLVDIGAISERARNDDLVRHYYQQYLDLKRTGQDKSASAGTLDDVSIIYTKGNLVSYALDLTIQDLTKGNKDFYDLTRYLSQTYWGASISNDQLLAAVNYVTGNDLSAFFAKYVNGVEELPLQISEGKLTLRK